MKLATICWVRDPKNDRDQFCEITLRRLQFLVNQGRNIPLTIAHVLLSTVAEVNSTVKPTMVILCGSHFRTGVTMGMVYSFRCIGEMEKGVVEVLNREFPEHSKTFQQSTRRLHPETAGAD